VRYESRSFGRFPGMQPFGTYPIHIIVKNGRTTLLGVVDNEADKTVAGIRARETTGVFAVDVDGQAGTSDQLAVSDTAQLAGTVAVNIVTLPGPGLMRYVILTAPGGVTDNGLSLSTSPALHATLLFPDPTTVELGIAVDFTTSGLSRNERSVANNLNSVFLAGGGGVRPVLLGLLNTAQIPVHVDARSGVEVALFDERG